MKKYRFRFCNEQSRAVTLHLEPWGEQFPLAPNAVAVITAEGPEGEEMLEVVVEDDAVIVNGWAGSTVQVEIK